MAPRCHAPFVAGAALDPEQSRSSNIETGPRKLPVASTQPPLKHLLTRGIHSSMPQKRSEPLPVAGQFQSEVSGNRRYAFRRSLRVATALSSPSADAVIHDLSNTGMLLETAEEVSANQLLLVEIPNFRPVTATVVWNSGRFFGCKFDEPIPAAALSGAFLRSAYFDPCSRIADEQTCNDSPPLDILVVKAESDSLPLASRLVVFSVIAVAVCAPVAMIAALLS